jgi:hypothetical protein
MDLYWLDIPRHQFTQVPGHSGGFYHFVCQHGVSNLNPLINIVGHKTKNSTK